MKKPENIYSLALINNLDMNLLSVVIPFLNEKEEVEITIKEIIKTAQENVDIILVNDASTDNYDYKKLASLYNITYIENKTRVGSAAARDIGISNCKTPYFLTIDGHMRFYFDDWWTKIIEAIKDNESAIYCCRCKAWDYDTKIESTIPPTYGAWVCIGQLFEKDILNVRWIYKDLFPGQEIVDIPCILGACYAASKSYWQLLKGNVGLKFYGCDEQNISIKAWMHGGRCRLIKNVTVGHLFRDRMPYPHIDRHMIYNKLFIAETILPEEIKNYMYKIFNVKPQLLFSDEDWMIINDLKRYYLNNNICNYKSFADINNDIVLKLY